MPCRDCLTVCCIFFPHLWLYHVRIYDTNTYSVLWVTDDINLFGGTELYKKKENHIFLDTFYTLAVDFIILLKFLILFPFVIFLT